MIFNNKLIIFFIFTFSLSCFMGCTKIEDPKREVSQIKTATIKERAYNRYSCKFFNITLGHMLDLFNLTDVKYEEIKQKLGNDIQHIMTYENGSRVIATEEEKGNLVEFQYIRNKKEDVYLYGDNFLSEEECSKELDFMSSKEAEENCRKELKRLGIVSDLMVESVYGINQNYIMKMYAQADGTGFGEKENMTKEREAYQFRFQIACDGVPFSNKTISKGVLEYIGQPDILITYSIKGIEYFSMNMILDHLTPIGKAKLISQQEAENIALKIHGQAEAEEEKGTIINTEIVYLRVPVKIKTGKGNQDLSEYECIPCWQIDIQNKVTWDNTKKTELVTFTYLLQGDTGERL